MDFASLCRALAAQLRERSHLRGDVSTRAGRLAQQLDEIGDQRWLMAGLSDQRLEQQQQLAPVSPTTALQQTPRLLAAALSRGADLEKFVRKLATHPALIAACLLQIHHFSGPETSFRWQGTMFHIIFASAANPIDEWRVAELLAATFDIQHERGVSASDIISKSDLASDLWARLLILLTDWSPACQLFAGAVLHQTVQQVLSESNIPLEKVAEQLLANVSRHANLFPAALAFLMQHIYRVLGGNVAARHVVAELIFGASFLPGALCEPLRYGLTPYPVVARSKFTLMRLAQFLYQQSLAAADNPAVMNIVDTVLRSTVRRPPVDTLPASVVCSISQLASLVQGLVTAQGAFTELAEDDQLLPLFISASDALSGETRADMLVRLTDTVGAVEEVLERHQQKHISISPRGVPVALQAEHRDVSTCTDNEMTRLEPKKTRFSVPVDEESCATTVSDQLEVNFEPSEIASTRSLGSMQGSSVDSSESLSDVVSANLSGRASPEISGRETPMSHVSSVLEERPQPPNVPVTVIKADQSNVTELFNKFELNLEDQKSTVSTDAWSVEVVASDSEAGEPPPTYHPPLDSIREPGDGGSAWSIEVQRGDGDYCDIANMSDVIVDESITENGEDAAEAASFSVFAELPNQFLTIKRPKSGSFSDGSSESGRGNGVPLGTRVLPASADVCRVVSSVIPKSSQEPPRTRLFDTSVSALTENGIEKPLAATERATTSVERDVTSGDSGDSDNVTQLQPLKFVPRGTAPAAPTAISSVDPSTSAFLAYESPGRLPPSQQKLRMNASASAPGSLDEESQPTPAEPLPQISPVRKSKRAQFLGNMKAGMGRKLLPKANKHASPGKGASQKTVQKIEPVLTTPPAIKTVASADEIFGRYAAGNMKKPLQVEIATPVVQAPMSPALGEESALDMFVKKLETILAEPIVQPPFSEAIPSQFLAYWQTVAARQRLSDSRAHRSHTLLVDLCHIADLVGPEQILRRMQDEMRSLTMALDELSSRRAQLAQLEAVVSATASEIRVRSGHLTAERLAAQADALLERWPDDLIIWQQKFATAESDERPEMLRALVDQMVQTAPHLRLSLERAVYERVYRIAIFPQGDLTVAGDQRLSDCLSQLARDCPAADPRSGLPPQLVPFMPSHQVAAELETLVITRHPLDKLVCLCRATDTILDILSALGTAGADELLPVIVFSLIHANPPHLLSTIKFIKNYLGSNLQHAPSYDQPLRTGSTGYLEYTLNQYEAALVVITSNSEFSPTAGSNHPNPGSSDKR